MAHRRRVEWVNESLIEDGVMGCRGIHGEGGVFFFFFGESGERGFLCSVLPYFFVKQKICFVGPRAYVTPNKRGARNFCLGGPICVTNLLVYTNFHTYTQTQVNIVKSLKLHVS